MALDAGSVTVDPDDGTYTGSGIALALMDGKVAGREAAFAAFGITLTTAHTVALNEALKAECETTAAGLVTALSAADVRVTAGALDTGVPSVTRVLSGAVE